MHVFLRVVHVWTRSATVAVHKVCISESGKVRASTNTERKSKYDSVAMMATTDNRRKLRRLMEMRDGGVKPSYEEDMHNAAKNRRINPQVLLAQFMLPMITLVLFCVQREDAKATR